MRLALLSLAIVFVACGADDVPTDTPPASNDPVVTGDGGPKVTADGGVAEPERCASPPCADGDRCKDDVDCRSAVCEDRTCFPAGARDGVKNGTETDVDCGGDPDAAPRCDPGKTCAGGNDCESLVCAGGTCQVASSTDAVKNGTETDVDCGGGEPTNAPRCATGKACGVTADCDAVLCTAGVCAAPANDDAIKNGTETDVDCGGPGGVKRCETGQTCGQTSDCNLVACSAGVCQPPTKSDGIKNGSETDVDCGGGAPTNASPCAVDKICGDHDDCLSSACAITGPKAGRCVPFKSCVKDEGGFTCGRNDEEFGGTGKSLESCCDTAALAGTTAKLNRFAITAGRMRAFIERENGNVRKFVQTPATKPAGWQAAWDVLVPSTVAEAEMMLGQYWFNAPNDPNTTSEKPHSKRSCGNDQYNGHTYYVEGEAGQNYSRAQLDPKVLNCVGWHLVTAFCAWDGGRLATVAELRNAFTNGSTTTWPWGYAGSPYNQAFDAGVQDSRLNHKYIYGFPGGTPGNNRITWWLSPPGRFWRGWNKNKVEIIGNVLEWASDAEYRHTWNMSFENHEGQQTGDNWRTPNDRSDVPNGYYALGARCAYP